MPALRRTGSWSTFRHRDFALYCLSRFVSAFAIQVQTVAVGWLVYDLTSDPFALGLVGLAEFLPAMLLALFTGQVADRFDRRRVLLCAYAMVTCTSLGLMSFALSGDPEIWPIYALLVVFGVARAFANPAGQALVPNLVPPAELGSAIAWNSSALQTATIAGPAAGGLLWALGAEAVFGASVAGFVLAFCGVLAIRARSAKVPREPVTWASLIAGFTFIRSRPIVFGAISLDLFAVLLGGAVALLPIYARDILKIGPSGLGLLQSMPAAGAFLMAMLLVRRPLERGTGRKMLLAVGIFGAAVLVFSQSRWVPLSLACLFVMGAADMVSVVIRQTLVQLETPDLMRGRVSAVNSVFVGASNELGAFRAGTMADLLGAVPAVALGGIGTMAVAVLWSRLFPALRDVERLDGRKGDA